MKQQAWRLLSGAAVALAATGSGCLDMGTRGLIRPPPPRLVCVDIAYGQSLSASVGRSADTLQVTVRTVGVSAAGWKLVSVSDLVGAMIVRLRDPRPGTKEPLELSLLLLTPNTTRVNFSVAAVVFGFQDDSCAVSRTFYLDVSPGGVLIADHRSAHSPGLRASAPRVVAGRRRWPLDH